MPDRGPSVVVTGDVCVDWISIPVPGVPSDGNGNRPLNTPNWRIHDGTRMIAREGGALLLRRLVDAALNADGHVFQVGGPVVPDIPMRPVTEIVHSMFAVEQFKLHPDSDDDEPRVWRVQRFDGAHGPAARQYQTYTTADMDHADILVIDDAGNGFRDADPKDWPSLNDTSWVVLKMSMPLASGALWNHLIEEHADRLITIVDANDVRKEGVQISEGISWERTAMDTVGHLMTNQLLAGLCRSAHLLIRYGCEGALHHWRKGDEQETSLHFVPSQIEGATADSFPGKMTGLAATFTAGIVKLLVQNWAKDGAIAGIETETEVEGEGNSDNGTANEGTGGIKEGIRRSQSLYKMGFTTDTLKPEELDYPCARLFQADMAGAPAVASVRIGHQALDSAAGGGLWSIAAERLGPRALKGAREVVVSGSTDSLKDAPIGRFGKLETVDRGEIESYRTIRNLIREYRDDPKPKRPLCIAVFGPPGAGKSFGVKQVAKSMDGASISADGVEFNVSQFRSPDDLVRALNRVRDSVLKGRLPLVFFDEFDSAMDDEALGWIKYFLMPMQDGEFRDGEVIHPIGKSIFVFAGGVFDSLSSFGNGRIRISGDATHGEHARFVELTPQQVKNAKVPDFISRLRGFVDVTGPNPYHPSADRLYQIRRALLLRSLLKDKRSNLLNTANKTIDMDHFLIDALIHVPKFKHGARSMEAIIDMSSTAGRKRFDQSALPPAEQLELHVDSQVLLELIQLGPTLDDMANEAHQEYLRTGEASEAANTGWDSLDEGYKESNRRQVLHIPAKLRLINVGIVRSANPTNFDGFTEGEVDWLAMIEHQRWCDERISLGWRHEVLEKQDRIKKLHPYLIPWDQLPEPKKNLDRSAVRHIPKILEIGGLRLVRLGPPTI